MSYINGFWGGSVTHNEAQFANLIRELGECRVGPYTIVGGSDPIWESLSLYYCGDLVYSIRETPYGDYSISNFDFGRNLLVGFLDCLERSLSS